MNVITNEFGTSFDWPSRTEVLSAEDLLMRTTDLNAEMDSSLIARLNEMGEICLPGDDPRILATSVLNRISNSRRIMMSWLTAKLWRPGVNFNGVPTSILSERVTALIRTDDVVLNSEQVENEVTSMVTELLNRREYDLAGALLRKFPSASPVGYASHIEMSGHDSGNGQAFEVLVSENGLDVSGPFLEIGARGGNTTAEMIRRGIVDPEKDNVVLVDPNEPCLSYAGKMLRSSLGGQLQLEPKGIEDVARDSEIGAAYSALTIQWIDSEGDGEPIVPRVIGNLSRVLERDGLFLFVGEEPVNATAATPMSVEDGLDIGFSEGALSYSGAQRTLQRQGFELAGDKAVLVRLSIPTPDPAFVATLDPDTQKIVGLLDAYSDHYAVATAYRNAGKSREL